MPGDTATDNEALAQDRPDPRFKEITSLKAIIHGLKNVPTELQQSLRTDLILIVPAGVSVKDTMFDCFDYANLIEFKSVNDLFDEYEFLKNETRVNLFRLENRDIPINRVQNVIVTSRKPDRFFQFMKTEGYEFQQAEGRKWQWHCRVGLQNVVVIVCRDLPVEKLYYDWLIFAPPESPAWQLLLVKLLEENNIKLLRIMQSLHPKEFAMAIDKVRETDVDGYLSREVWDYIRDTMTPEKMEDWKEGARIMLNMFKEDAPDRLGEVLDLLTPQQRMIGLLPEQILSGLKPEERLSGLKPEERLSGLKPEERLSGLKPEERLSGLKPEEQQALLKLLLEQNQNRQDKQDKNEEK